MTTTPPPLETLRQSTPPVPETAGMPSLEELVTGTRPRARPARTLSRTGTEILVDIEAQRGDRDRRLEEIARTLIQPPTRVTPTPAEARQDTAREIANLISGAPLPNAIQSEMLQRLMEEASLSNVAGDFFAPPITPPRPVTPLSWPRWASDTLSSASNPIPGIVVERLDPPPSSLVPAASDAPALVNTTPAPVTQNSTGSTPGTQNSPQVAAAVVETMNSSFVIPDHPGIAKYPECAPISLEANIPKSKLATPRLTLTRSKGWHIVPWNGKFFYFRIGDFVEISPHLYKYTIKPATMREGLVVIDKFVYYVTYDDLRRGIVRKSRKVNVQANSTYASLFSPTQTLVPEAVASVGVGDEESKHHPRNLSPRGSQARLFESSSGAGTASSYLQAAIDKDNGGFSEDIELELAEAADVLGEEQIRALLDLED